MANKKVWVIVLYMLSFNLLMVAINESDMWGTDDMAVKDIDTANVSGSITEITDIAEVEPGGDIPGALDLFDTLYLIIKSIGIIIYAFAAIPLVGGLMFSYGVPLSICAIFEAINLYLLAVLWAEFGSNRRISQ